MYTALNEGDKLVPVHSSGSFTRHWPANLYIYLMPRALVSHSQSSREDDQTPLKLSNISSQANQNKEHSTRKAGFHLNDHQINIRGKTKGVVQ